MAERARAAGAQRRRAAPLSAALLLIAAGCASHPDASKPSEPQMIGLLAVLPGTYDNSAQAELEARTGVRPGHVAVALAITHVYAPRLGHYVYYAQETAAGEPLRVLSQKVYSFKFDEKRGIVETLYSWSSRGAGATGSSTRTCSPASTPRTCRPRAASCCGRRRTRASSRPMIRRSARTRKGRR